SRLTSAEGCCRRRPSRRTRPFRRYSYALFSRYDRSIAENPATHVAPHAPQFHGHRSRLRARFRDSGAEAINDYEFLELVLFRAIPRRDVKLLAKNLIATFGSFAE